MKSVRIRSAKQSRKAQSSQSEPTMPLPSDELYFLIAKRAHELYSERGYRQGYALDDWLEAEREILSRTPP
jgi:hypothetical protein